MELPHFCTLRVLSPVLCIAGYPQLIPSHRAVYYWSGSESMETYRYSAQFPWFSHSTAKASALILPFSALMHLGILFMLRGLLSLSTQTGRPLEYVGTCLAHRSQSLLGQVTTFDMYRREAFEVSTTLTLKTHS